METTDKKLVVYHLHTTLSMLDSTTWFDEYLKEAKKRRLPAIAVTEHGNIFNWAKNMDHCKADKEKEDDYDMKYMMGVEAYLTESLDVKVRDNYHTILIARNKEGAMELCKLMTIAQDEKHMYYKPRISFDEFLGISNNIISISACLGSPLRHLSDTNPYYYRLVEKYDFLEIQGHNIQDQIEYNKKLLDISKKYNKPLIFGTDTHELDSYRLECRKIKMKSNNINYTGEDECNLTFLTYEEAYNMCKKQNAIPIEEYEKALDNTLVLADMVEPFELDKKFKYPDHLYEDPKKAFYKAISKGIEARIKSKAIKAEDKDKYMAHIKEEYEILSAQGMQSFLVFMSELVEWCCKNDIPVGFGRGSVAGSTIAYLLNITDVDPIVWDTIFSRFCNSERISLADIDTDWAPADREKVYGYIQERFGEDRTSFIGTINTLDTKGAIDEIARALNISLSDAKTIKEKYCPLEDEAKTLRKIKKPTTKDSLDLKKIEEKIVEVEKDWPELFYYLKGVKGSAKSFGIHPAGIIASPLNLSENIGLMYNSKNKCWASQADMKTVDSLNYVKYDILGLKNIGIIKDAFGLAGKKYPMAHEINWEDEKVWEDMKKSPIGIFQYEGDYAFSLLKGFDVKNVKDLSLINASMRPSGASYREKVMNHIKNSGLPKEIYELLEDTLGYLVYQEQQIAFLQKFCKYSGGRADSVRRAIGKKDEVTLMRLIPEIKEAYIINSDKDRETAESEIEQFLQVFQDACDYSFGYNHSLSYSMIGYLCAYARYYHPKEFIASYLNNAANKDDIKDGTLLAKAYDVEIVNPEFGYSMDKYVVAKNGKIYKGIGSVNWLDNESAIKLKDLYDSYNGNLPELIEIFRDFDRIGVQQSKIVILIKIGYFKSLGLGKSLLEKYTIFNKYKDSKKLTKSKIDDEMYYMVEDACNRGVEGFEEKNKTFNINGEGLVRMLIADIEEEDFITYEKVCFELMYLNYVQTPLEVGGIAKVISISKWGSLKLDDIVGGYSGYFNNKSGIEFSKGDYIYITSVNEYVDKKGVNRKNIMGCMKLDIESISKL